MDAVPSASHTSTARASSDVLPGAPDAKAMRPATVSVASRGTEKGLVPATGTSLMASRVTLLATTV